MSTVPTPRSSPCPRGTRGTPVCRTLADVPEHLTTEIGHFFEIYKELEPGKGTDVRGWQDRAAAEQVIEAAFTRAGNPPGPGRDAFLSG